MTLIIYVLKDCLGCERARHTANEVRKCAPDIEVDLVDLSEGHSPPSSIFGVPAYVLNGQVVSHGNPRLETLLEMIAAQRGHTDGHEHN